MLSRAANPWRRRGRSQSRKQLDPNARAYAGLFEFGGVQKLTGDRQIRAADFEITPQLLELAKSASTADLRKKHPA